MAQPKHPVGRTWRRGPLTRRARRLLLSLGLNSPAARRRFRAAYLQAYRPITEPCLRFTNQAIRAYLACQRADLPKR